MSIVLLDTGVAGGLLASDATKSQEWFQLVQELLTSLPKGTRYAIPTPVWFEIAQWNPDWHKKVTSKIVEQKAGGTPDPLYQFAGYSIANNILMDAAWYRHACRGKMNSPDLDSFQTSKEKISFIDSILAAYCLRFDHYLLTLNQQDFPPKFFDILGTKVNPRTNTLSREFIHLVKPKPAEWLAARNT